MIETDFAAGAKPAVTDRSAIWAAVLAIAFTAALMLYSRQDTPNITVYIGLLSIGSAAVFACLWRAAALPPRIVFGVAALLHIIALFGVAAFEDDYFRFVWDGWRFIAAGTPYGIAPSEFFGMTLPANGAEQAGLALTLDGVNNPELPTIYGPTLQFIFALAYLVAGTDPVGLRVFFAAINLILVVLLLVWTKPERAALYAWCPLAISEIIIHIHPDGVMAMLLMAGLVAAKRYPVLAGLFFGLAAGTKIVALALWPLLLRMGPRAVIAAVLTLGAIYVPFFLQGSGAGFDSTETFAGEWYYNPLGFVLFDALLPSSSARWAAALLGIIAILLLHARTRRIDDAPAAMIFGVILFVAPAVNTWYLLWILPFAVKARMVWPFAAAAALPLSYFTGLNLGDQNLGGMILGDYEVHPAAWAAQIAILLAAVTWDISRHVRSRKAAAAAIPGAAISGAALTPIAQPSVAIIIPALNEEAAIGGVICAVGRQAWPRQPFIIVADNGSSDDTAAQARAAGACVVREEQRGYGAACLAGIGAVPKGTDIIVFLDGDGADNAAEAPGLIAPIIAGTADLVIGSRALGRLENGAMTVPQKFGNWLATRLVWLFWGERMTDLGPFRAIRTDALQKLMMADRDFGWTIEMQVKAVQQQMRITEIPADYRRRIGVSKISGTMRGVLLAGNKILYVIGREAFFR